MSRIGDQGEPCRGPVSERNTDCAHLKEKQRRPTQKAIAASQMLRCHPCSSRTSQAGGVGPTGKLNPRLK